MIGLVGQLAARRPQVAFPWRLPMDWASPMTGLVGQLAARRPQVAPLGVYQWIEAWNDSIYRALVFNNSHDQQLI